jgi:hypothetical protein
MHIGNYLSATLHIGVLSWVLLGGIFKPQSVPFEVSNVALITPQEFADLVLSDTAPTAAQVLDDLDPLAAQAEDSPAAPDPEQAVETMRAPMQNESPELPATAPKTPEALKMPTPDILDTSPQFAPLVSENMPQASQMSDRPVLRPAQRVALEEVAPPPPEVNLDDLRQEAAIPDDLSAPVAPPKEEASAPEAASREIVTEAEEMPSFAPQQSARPPKRPAAPPQPEVPAPEPEPLPEPAPLPEPKPDVDPTPEPTRRAETEAAVAAALADAIGETAPTGPPLTQTEEDTLRVAVQKCWVVDIGSPAANVTVVLGMQMTPEGKVKTGSLRLVSSQGGADSAAKTAFQAARRAVLRCQKGGYNLPTEKYEHWREIEMTFNPEKMR